MAEKINSTVFDIEELVVPGENEQIVVGGRDKFDLATGALKDAQIKQIGVIGWGSQGPAQAQNLRDSLEGSGISVKVGLREGSSSWQKAEEAGLEVGEMYSVLSESDLNILLISDAAQADNYKEIFKNLKPGSTLGLSHGFLLGHLKNVGDYFPENINVIGVCPKGMGPSVRRLYEQGKEVNGAGINSSFAVEKDVSGNATDIALAWAILIGSPFVFKTTLEDEFKSDIYGERGILLGAVHGIVEALYQKRTVKEEPQKVYRETVVNITGPISRKISKDGIKSIFEQFEGDDVFNKSLNSSYKECYPLLQEIYDEVASGNEIRGVILAGRRKQIFVPEQVDKTPMWRVGEKVRESKENGDDLDIVAETAGIYIGAMMAQIDVLRENGHSWSEIVNESIIEAVDSLNPYMHARGVDYMVDNCSRTARLGSRKWGPRFRACAEVAIYDDKYDEIDTELVERLKNHDVHLALKSCSELRPPVDIFVQ